MSNKVLLSVLGVAVVVVGGYFILTSDKVEDNNDVENNEVAEQSGKKMAFSQFVKQGGSYKCEVEQSVNDFENSGTVYISGGNIAGQYNTIAEGRTIDTSFVLKDGYSYTWSSFAPNMGFKVKMPDVEPGANTSIDATGTYSWNADQIGEYNCEPWVYSSAQFDLPKGVTFSEIGK